MNSSQKNMSVANSLTTRKTTGLGTSNNADDQEDSVSIDPNKDVFENILITLKSRFSSFNKPI